MCHYAEDNYVLYHYGIVLMLRIVMLSVNMLTVIMLIIVIGLFLC
jgi:hypothetical protein